MSGLRSCERAGWTPWSCTSDSGVGSRALLLLRPSVCERVREAGDKLCVGWKRAERGARSAVLSSVSCIQQTRAGWLRYGRRHGPSAFRWTLCTVASHTRVTRARRGVCVFIWRRREPPVHAQQIQRLFVNACAKMQVARQLEAGGAGHPLSSAVLGPMYIRNEGRAASVGDPKVRPLSPGRSAPSLPTRASREHDRMHTFGREARKQYHLK